MLTLLIFSPFRNEFVFSTGILIRIIGGYYFKIFFINNFRYCYKILYRSTFTEKEAVCGEERSVKKYLNILFFTSFRKVNFAKI